MQVTLGTGCHALPEGEMQRLSWGQAARASVPGNPLCVCHSMSGPSRSLETPGGAWKPRPGMGGAWATRVVLSTLQVLSGPLSPCSASGFQAGHPPSAVCPWSPNFRSPLRPRGDVSQPGQVHGGGTKGDSVLSSSLFRKPLKSVGVGI